MSASISLKNESEHINFVVTNVNAKNTEKIKTMQKDMDNIEKKFEGKYKELDEIYYGFMT